ncbi:MAG: M23 family metallopeptidase [Bacteroidetes bacterium]|nr:M23 family metallopeptidase [Bacteroidota bacterium]
MRRGKDLIIMVPLTLLAVSAVYFMPQRAVSALPVDQGTEVMQTGQIEEAPIETLYGIPLSGYRVKRGEVHRGQSLAGLLLPYGVSAKQIYEISLLPDSLLNERRIKPGNRFTLLSRNDSVPAIFIYEKDPLNYVTVYLDSEPVRAKNATKAVEQRLMTASGTIVSSLWESMLEADANPMMAVELSEIFAWTIDFFGVQEGDRYKVIYEESYVDSQSIGINRIMGAWIHHNNNDFWGIPFEQDEMISFFDEDGNSLRKAFLKAPLRFSRISSGFSNSRYHPVLKIRRPHHGVDYAAPSGTPVLTVGDGVITKIGYQKRGGGNYVKIKHNSVYSTTYMHLSRFGKDVRQGRYVKQGDVIGYVGATGLATGPHLDFRFYKNGSPVNPLKVEAPPVEPVHEENLSAYKQRLSFTMNVLKLI